MRPLLCAALLTLTLAAPALASDSSGYEQVGNWAGYQTINPATLDRVSATWIQPRNKCTKAIPFSIVSPWVGLGDPGWDLNGADTKIEQIGANETCVRRHGKTTQYARGVWEYWPAPSHTVKHPMAPGDKLHAEVSIVANKLTMTLQDLTKHWKFVKRLTVTAPDERSAEWIVEDTALSALPNQQSPLAGFSPVRFTDAQAGDTSGTTGAIDTSPWGASKIAMIFGTPSRLRAWPSKLTARGTSFTVTAADRKPPAEPPPPV